MQRYCILSGAIRTEEGEGVRHRGLMAVCCSPGALLAIQPPLSTAPRSSSNRRRQSSSSLFAIRENVPGIKFITEGNLPAIVFPPEYYSLFKKFPLNGFDSEKFYL